jgi:hypothetical protein
MQEEHPPWIRIVHNKDWLPPGDDFYEAEFPPPYAPAAATGWESFMLLAGILLGVLIATKGHADDTPPPAIVQPNDSAHGRPPLSGSG